MWKDSLPWRTKFRDAAVDQLTISKLRYNVKAK